MSAPVLETRGLAKSFGGVQAVAGVDLAMPRGEIRALIGPNGAGKTTFFNMLTGQLRADSGEVLFKGERLSGLPPHAVWRRGVSRTFQITATFVTLTVLEQTEEADRDRLTTTTVADGAGNISSTALMFVPDDYRRPSNLAVFLCRPSGGVLRPGDDAIDAAWFDLAALPAKLGFDNGPRILARLLLP